MEPAVMWIVGLAFAALPFVLAWLLNGDNRADSAGKRLSRRWHS